MAGTRASPRVLPGFGLTLGFTIGYLSLIVRPRSFRAGSASASRLQRARRRASCRVR